MNLREKILQAQDIEKEQVYIEQWDATIEVRTMTGGQRAKAMQEAVDPKTGEVNIGEIYPTILIASCFDPETNEQIFTEADRDELNGKNGAALEKLAQVAMTLSGLTGQSMEDIEKN